MLGNLLGPTQFSKPTAKELESALLHNLNDIFDRHHPLRRYISTTCVLRYLSARKSAEIYNNYDPFIAQITREVANFTARNLTNVRVYSVFSKSPLRRFTSVAWWLSQTAHHQKKVASQILLSTSKKGVFFDTRMLSETDKPAVKELLEGGEGFDDWLLGNPDRRNSIQDIAMAITDYLIEHGFSKGKPPQQHQLHPFIVGWLTEKRDKQKSRTEKTMQHIKEKMVATRLLKRIQLKLPQSQLHQKNSDVQEKSLESLSSLPDMLYDTMLATLLPLGTQERLMAAPPRLRSRLLCITLKNKLNTGHHSAVSGAANLVIKLYNFRLLLSSTDVSKSLLDGLRSFCSQAPEAIRTVIEDQLRHIQKLSFLSVPDKVRMQTWTTHYRVAQCQLEHNFTTDLLHSTNPVLSMYLSGRDKGVTAGRLRKLFESLLGQEPGHDIFHQHLRQLAELFERWPDNHAKVLNKIVDFLQSQIGGSQLSSLRFNHWNRFRQLAKGAITLYHSTYHNLQDAVELTAMDCESVAAFHKSLKQSDFVHKDSDVDLLKVATSMGLLDAFPGYLRTIAINKTPWAYEFPAIDTLVSEKTADLHVEIRPHNDLIGIMGVAAHGVCIPFAGHAHISHWNNAVAHLVVRDNEKIWLWGLLLRDQRDSKTPQYFLNNLQGSLPSRHSKQKDAVASSIRAVLSEIGHVFFKDLFFNAVSLKTDELAKSIDNYPITLPSLRLDISNYRKGVDGADSSLCVINEPTMVLRKPDAPLLEFNDQPFGGLSTAHHDTITE